MLGLLTACSTAPSSITEKDFSRAAPDVMTMSVADQSKAGKELLKGQCPYLNKVATLCLVTLDEARAEAGVK